MNEPLPAISSPDLTGRELGDYRILRRLGSGGMAEVYLAEQRSLSRQVALKVLRAQLANDANYVQRFLNEARAAASLVHPNIVQIYEVGQADGVHFIAQEYVRGKNLAEVLQRQRTLEPRLVLDILRQVVFALCKAHEMGIVHRDIKPENILLSHSGEVKVADFGLARVLNADTKTLTQVGVAMGTPLYMSPEQIEGRPVDVRSDIYSLGATCYHLLSGAAPHTGDTALAIALQHLNNPPRPLANVRQDIPGDLARLVHRMLSKRPDDRPESPGALLRELRDLANDAAQQGWAEGPDHWPLAEWIAAEESRSASSAQLSQLMKASARLQLGRRKWGRLSWGLAAAVLLGVVLGAVTRPRSYLAGSRSASVPRRASAGAQLYHAKMADSEAAWRAVWEMFPKADPFLHQLAKQGLVRHYLLVSQEYPKALPILRELSQRSASDKSLETLRAFTLAGFSICYQHLGREHEAREAHAQLKPKMKDYLHQHESQLYELLQTSVRQASGSPKLDPLISTGS